MLIQRLLAAIVLIPLVILLLFFAQLSIFACIMIAVGGLAAWEWSQFLHITNKHLKLMFTFFIVVIVALLYFMPISFEIKSRLYNIILSLSIIWWLVALYLVISYPKTIHYWSNVAVKLIFAFFTLVPFFLSMIELRSINYNSNCYTGAILLLYVFVLVWATDTGAYFAGRMFGKRKLAPKVSPGKTVEGFIGGVSVALIISLIVYYSNLFNIKFNVFFISSLFAILVSVLGDLTESMFKREAGIKDSGYLIPGHGGILDRIDSLTAAVPIFTALSLYLS
ncbi:phosphatidate cytidylyltransferase [Gilliamella sp. B2776]|uniref:phosphatidate cytidylyltransferase n=1 Tax=unclassified Gilliamella TaxID=2685620 RepID=UPI002269A817|nr:MULTISPECIES: phosphatidate cytidylyltransferase [unclassified Gilliamella]MCX8648806.1 phosphatidate cytidylyltransferase [Gilliamella sp. B2779]MCX8653318.1 phosphatidate cytidylyltransferase [Gilliamella sp. B2737]MCX8655594.1 phosphatidate cytidylyltransferase [Gilliamella sp. B2894]MCX8664344.1 phosphatidate cytidylyltransferase [Gilliamella sp. B2887]MCX8690618.1 phosphatidate cytidylyltransferase [Gilliamella sp. B2776]